MVDQTGRRYGNECLPYDRFGRIMAEAPERIPSWFVFDNSEGGRLPAIAMPEGDPADHLAAGTWVTADTIDGLATAIGVDPAVLTETVERFNGFAAAGVDKDFGRGEDEYDTFFAGGSGPNKALTPVERAPYFAARFVLSDLGTKGGLVTDEAGRVLDEATGSPIPGLYATQQLGRVGLRVALPGTRRTARCGDGVRLARGSRPGGPVAQVRPLRRRGARAPSRTPCPGPAPARG